MHLSDFDFNLPPELIAQVPLELRDQSRLMIVNRQSNSLKLDLIQNIHSYLSAETIMVFNNTQVIPAKLFGYKQGKKQPIELLLIRKIASGVWETFLKGLSRLKIGTELTFGIDPLKARLIEKRNGRAILEFSGISDPDPTLFKIAKTPLPPYIKRDLSSSLDSMDRERYQTVYAQKPGAVAAPTAGLHFTHKLLKKIRGNKIKTLFLTLNVGPGTFQPIRTEKIYEHKMEREYFSIPIPVWQDILKAKNAKKPVLAVGTTTTRALESEEVFSKSDGDFQGWTDKFIYPGYKFKMVDQLLTNFHLPKSTLFMLVCAFAGKELMTEAYKKAIAEKFRFFSYGDAMLIL